MSFSGDFNMIDQLAIPCLVMRGGTSRGPYFLKSDLPEEIAARDRVLLAVMGSPDLRQIDGIAGADTLTSKVAIVSKSERPGVDVDYLFAQVDIARPIVDTSPSCGNMISGVGPFAILKGLVKAQDGVTTVVIFDVNTKSRIEAVVQTPGGEVVFDGEAAIDGVPGTAAPIVLNFMEAVGAKTGKMLPTGHAIDVIDGIECSCLDVCMPMVMMRATDLGLTGIEGRAQIDGNTALLARIEAIRLQAGVRMGFGDVKDMVIPKVGLLSPPRAGGAITSRYLTPHKLHAAHAVTGAVCVATACLLEGSIAYPMAVRPEGNPSTIWIEHPSGQADVRMQTQGAGAGLQVIRAGVMRTARPVMGGHVFVSRRKVDIG
jgi:2-methylaconitate cis-trans-isomerase PrpF